MDIPTVRALVYQRGKYYAAEVRLALGPEVEGDISQSGFEPRHGYVWGVVKAGDGTKLVRYLNGEWQEVGSISPLNLVPDEAEHLSIAFDQAGRPLIAWELAGQIEVLRFDLDSSAWIVQTVTPGHDPVLINDAVINQKLGGSDVKLIYASADRLRVLWREQRELFLIERQSVVLSESVRVDQVSVGGLKLYVWLADEQGDALLDDQGQAVALVSDLYPYLAGETLTVALSARGEYVETTQNKSGADALGMALSARGRYDLNLYLRQDNDPINIALSTRGEYQATLFLKSGADALNVALSTRGRYQQTTSPYPDADALGMALSARGEYRATA